MLPSARRSKMGLQSIYLFRWTVSSVINLETIANRSSVKSSFGPYVRYQSGAAIHFSLTTVRYARYGASEDIRAIALAWLFHLIGDIHQPAAHNPAVQS